MVARRAELASAIAVLSSAASTLSPDRGSVSVIYIGDSTPDKTGGGATLRLALVTRSLQQAGRLREQFDQRWGFTRDRTLSAALEVSVCACVCVRVCVCACLRVCVCACMRVRVFFWFWCCIVSFDIILPIAP